MHPITTFDLVRRDHEERLAAARAERARRPVPDRRDPSSGASGRPPEQRRRPWLVLAIPALAGPGLAGAAR
ncbi:hypothetical protein Q760_02095 [Cellulomonas cellasea DSM 20118]|uniref:Uncharacterized protein n=2 Tax=Cellulomonas cellasea TaxID=43670 RepID=A0A0A0B563_9CELL|nr:hypothetical protein Q760_02095 [Cellulomonas cellasea DSM 20118]GEA88463.1 hypothetical protein CCE01nite_24120 [Cellulomonas cellasea]